MEYNFAELRKQITPEQIIQLCLYLGAVTYEERENCIIFPTICHNHTENAKNMKLYYYLDTRLFHCYTECNSSFDIFELFLKVKKINGIDTNLGLISSEIVSRLNLKVDSETFDVKYEQPLKKSITGESYYEYPLVNEKLLNLFQTRRLKMWEDEGIDFFSLLKFNISFYLSKNKIIIPHYDILNRLIGIRVRNIEEEDTKYGKYMPLQLQNVIYSHPLSFNLYGLNITKDAIKKSKKCYVFEGEKSVLKMQTIYGEENNSVAVCGSVFNKYHLMLLKKNCDVEEIIICFDRQFKTRQEEEKYFLKLQDMCQKYKYYTKISFIFDDDKLLKYKDAPIDQGKEIFEKLVSERRTIR